MMRRALSRGLAPTARHLSSGAGAPVQLSNDEMRRALEDQVRLRLAQAQVGAAETLVPYVVNQLPAAYQRIVPESVREENLLLLLLPPSLLPCSARYRYIPADNCAPANVLPLLLHSCTPTPLQHLATHPRPLSALSSLRCG